jgi:hypothetical protein
MERPRGVHRSGSPRDSGAVAVIVALCIVALGAFLALVMNIAHALDNRAQLLAAADSAALAGALSLDGTDTGAGLARTRAYDFMVSHDVDKNDITINLPSATLATQAETDDVVVGCWDNGATPANKASGFTRYPTIGSCDSLRDINAVRARNGLDGTSGHNQQLPTVFGYFVNDQSMSVRSEAVAVGGGPCTSCAIPLAFAECQVVLPSNTLNCASVHRFGNSNIDSIMFTSLSGTQPASTSNIVGATTCVGGATPPCCREVDDSDVRVANGNNLNQQVADALAQYVGCWVEVPVVDVPCSLDACGVMSPSNFTGTRQVKGFLRLRLRAVCGDNSGGVGAGGPLACGPPPSGSGGGSSGGSGCTGGTIANCPDVLGNPHLNSYCMPGETCPTTGRAIVFEIDCGWNNTRPSGCSVFGGISPTVRIVR